MNASYEFENAELKTKAGQLTQSMQAQAEHKSRHEQLDDLAKFINDQLRWAKADKPNIVKKQALAAIEALKKGENVQANNQILRATLSIIKAAEEQSLTAAVFHTQNLLAVQKYPNNKMAQALLNLTQAILDFKQATLTQPSLGLGLMLDTFGAFKNNLGALDAHNKKTWAPSVTDDASFEMALNYLDFLLFTRKHIQKLPIKEQAPGFVFNVIAGALNYEGHAKAYDQYDVDHPTKNSVIDNTRKRIETFQDAAVDVSIVDGDNAIVEYAQQFVQTCDKQGKFDQAGVILDIAQKVVTLNQFDQYFAQSLKGSRDHLVAQTEQLERARFELNKFGAKEHKMFSDEKVNNEKVVTFVQNILLEIAADDDLLQKEINTVCQNMLVGNTPFSDKTNTREVACGQLQKIISTLVKNNAEQLHDIIGTPKHDEPEVQEKSVWQQIKAWFQKIFSKKDHAKPAKKTTAEHEILYAGLCADDPEKNNNAKLYKLLTDNKLDKIKPAIQIESHPVSVRVETALPNLAGNAAQFKQLTAKFETQEQRQHSDPVSTLSHRSIKG